MLSLSFARPPGLARRVTQDAPENATLDPVYRQARYREHVHRNKLSKRVSTGQLCLVLEAR